MYAACIFIKKSRNVLKEGRKETREKSASDRDRIRMDS